MDLITHYEEINIKYEYYNPICLTLFDQIASLSLPKNTMSTIIELGGGTGNLLRYISDNHNAIDSKYFSLDISHGMCKSAKKNQIQSINADYNYLPFPDKTIDIFIFKESIHHAVNNDVLKLELSRCLKKSGFLIIITLVDWSIPESNVVREYVSIAKTGVKVGSEVIESVLYPNFSIEKKYRLECRQLISSRFARDAIENAALSNWRMINTSQRKKDGYKAMIEIENNAHLVRIYDTFIVKNI